MQTTRVAKALAVASLIGLASALAAAAPKEVGPAAAEKGKAEATDRPKLSVIRLGQTRDEIVSKYGKPDKTVTLASGIESLSYQHGGIRLLVEVAPKTKQVIQIYYFKATPFSGVQISELLERNAESSKWSLVAATDRKSVV